MRTVTNYTFEEFLDAARRPAAPWVENVTSEVQAPSISGGATFADAHRLAREGWPEGLAKMNSVRKQLRQLEPQMAERVTSTYADCGDEVCVSRFVDGEPEHMMEFVTEFVPATGRVVRVTVMLGASSGISPEQIFRRGAVAVAIIDALEQQGFRVELVASAHSGNKAASKGGTVNAHTDTINILIKRAEDPLELDRVAFVAAHAAMLRRLVFRAREQGDLTVWKRIYSHAQGYSMELPVEERGEVYIGRLFLNEIKTDADMLAYVNATLARYTETEVAA